MVVVNKDVGDHILQLSSGALRYIILRIRDDEIFVSTKGPRKSSHDDFLRALKEDGCSYGVIDPEESVPSSPENLILICWAPGSATIQNKIFYSSAYFILQNTINIDKTIQATEDEEVTAEAVKNA